MLIKRKSQDVLKKGEIAVYELKIAVEIFEEIKKK